MKELGTVYEGWKNISVEDVCTQVSVGIVIQPAQYYVAADEGIRAFRSANVRESKINDSDWVYLSSEGQEKNRKSVLRAGDVLVVRSGYPGTSCVVSEEYAGSNCIDILFARPDLNEILPEYLCAFTNSDGGKRQVLGTQGGLAQKHLNVGAYKKLRLPLPPIYEQQRIIEILSTWDEAIGTVEKLIENSKAQKKALMQQLLMGKRRFPGFQGSEWERVRISDLVNIFYGKSPKDIWDENGKLPVLGTGGVTGKTSTHMHNGPAVIIGRKGTIDKPYYVSSPFWAIDTTFFCLPKQHCDTKWFFYLMNSFNLKKYNEASGVPSLSRETIYSIRVLAPNKEEQEKIAATLTICDSEISSLNSELHYLRQEKKALMQQLLTGKRRVKVDEP